MWWCCSNSVSPVHNMRKELSRSIKISSSGCQIKPLICFTSGAAGPFVHLLFVSLEGRPSVACCVSCDEGRIIPHHRLMRTLHKCSQVFDILIRFDIKQQDIWHCFFVSILITAYCFVMSIVGLVSQKLPTLPFTKPMFWCDFRLLQLPQTHFWLSSV